jgi:hypothetical protein
MAEAPDEDSPKLPSTPVRTADPVVESLGKDDVASDDEEGGDEEDGPEDEPKLKYHRLTDSITSIYKGGDATSSFLVSGDKLVRAISRFCPSTNMSRL